MVSKIWLQSNLAATKLAEVLQDRDKVVEARQRDSQAREIRKHQRVRNSSVRPVRSGQGEDMVNLADRIHGATEKVHKKNQYSQKSRYLRGIPTDEEVEPKERKFVQLQTGGHVDLKG